MPGPKKQNPFESETPSRGQRVDALGERLSELRTKLGALATDTAAESAARASSHDLKSTVKGETKSGPKSGPKLPEAGGHEADDEKLALLVFNTIKGDTRRLREFVQHLARLEAAAAKSSPESAKKSDKGT